MSPWRARRAGGFERHQYRRLEAEQLHVSHRLREAIVHQAPLSVGQLQLEQPADVDDAARQTLGQARQPHGAVRRRVPEVGDLLLEPLLELVRGDRDAGVTADGELEHGSIVSHERAGENGFNRVFRDVVEAVSVLGMPVPLKTRILLADDHTVVRGGLRLVLDAQPDLEVVAEASDGAEAVDLALQEDVDLAILDVTMPRKTGLQAAAELSKRRPDLRTLILSMHDNEQYFFEALKAGASGYVLKSAANRDLIEACRAAMRGEPFLYPEAVRALIRDFLEHARRGDDTPQDPLTPRELEIVKLIAEGHTSEEIGEMLFISKKTVDRHRANVLEKLGMRNRVELTRYAIRRGLVEP